MADLDSISSKIDELLNKDFQSLTAEDIVKIVTGENLDIPYEDLQSEEGFNKELEKTSKEIEEVIKTLEPQPPPIPMEDIEKLACQFEGDSLYAKILAETAKREDPDLYKELLESGSLDDRLLSSEDIGVRTNIKSLLNRDISSSSITRYLEEKNPDFLERTNEKIFDNLDPLTVGKPSNSGSRKKRDLKVLGFNLPIEFIMANKKIAHARIFNKRGKIAEIIEKINSLIKKQNENTKPCDFKDISNGEDDIDSEGVDVSGDSDNLRSGPSLTSRIDDYDSNFFPDGDDPVLDQDCEPGLPEDPITGDVILTKESFNSIIEDEDFCDPPAYDFSRINLENPDEPDPTIEGPDDPLTGQPSDSQFYIDSIEGCLDSAMEKSDKIEEKLKLLGRWTMIERNIEEIYYHYDIIWEYQKTLYEEYTARFLDIPNKSGDNLQLDLAISILTYSDIIRETEREIFFLTEELSANIKIFLERNNIFTNSLFSLTIPDTELDAESLRDLFNQKITENKSLINYNQSNQSWPIDDGINDFFRLVEDIRFIILKKNQITLLNKKIEENKDLREADIKSLEKEINAPVDINNLENVFKNASNWSYSGGSTYEQDYAEEVFKNPAYLFLSGNPYKGYGYEFLGLIKKFSARFTDIDFNYQDVELTIKLGLFTDIGNPLPYKAKQKPNKISFSGRPSPPLITVNEPDVEKIKIGNEYAANGGLLVDYPKDYFKGNKSLIIKNVKEGERDVAEFYSFLRDVISTGKSKRDIIDDIEDKRGVLYAQLIEKSSSNWLFFTSEERGDNDARDPSRLRPSSFNDEGEPNPVFVDFWSTYKIKWNEKYKQNKNEYILPYLERVKTEARKAGLGLGKTLNVNAIRGIRIIENYFDIQKKYEQIQEILLVAAKKISEIEESLKPENVEKEFSDIKCAGASNLNDEGDPENCPPPCCGPAGSDFRSGGNFITSSPPSSDCPTIYQRCWWKQFSKDLTKVGLLPYPNGLPPIERTSYFLSPGPSVRMGLKYWPVGYLPPSFIPIPFPNPVDGTPYIRIPLPMIWTIIQPILIPLPFNLGIMVIFIPFIGGFMPTPLVYIKEFITGSSFFLTGLRGPRFIPRKSDPNIRDPLEKIKQALSFGIPDKLINLPGFGKVNIDGKDKILADIQSNLTKILDSIPPPGDIPELREVQERELQVKNNILQKRKDFNKKAALLDDPAPDLSQEQQELNALIQQRRDSLKSVIKDYLEKGIPNPKDLYFPKEKDSLKIDIPGIVKSLRILKEMKASFVPITCGENINFKDEIREVLKLLRIPTPIEYSLDNFGVSNSSKIFLRIEKDPRLMEEEEFRDMVKRIKNISMIITHILLKGNKFSVVKKIRKGAFSIIDNCEYQGTFAFPPIKITNSVPSALKFLKVKNPILTAMYLRIMEGMSKVEYTREDFSRYVRYNGESPLTVIRVKDLKKLISRKLGISRRGPFDPERPLDREEPLLSNFPHPEGPLCCLESLNGSFGNAIALFELPTVFPVKSDQITQIQGLGGIVQVKIPGSKIKSFLIESIDQSMDSLLNVNIPEINDINSPKFTNLQPNDIQKIIRNMVRSKFDPESPDLPSFLNIVNIPIIPPARPTDIIEQALIGLGAPPPARIVYSLYWKFFKGVAKTPLLDSITRPPIELAGSILPKIPWPLTVLLGRNLVNIINPIAMSDDHPVWRRMSLKNTYYVIYLDEFLRSAADVSGLFKFFFGAADTVYPIPELPSELQKAFNLKKY